MKELNIREVVGLIADEFEAEEEPSAFELPPAAYEYEGVEDEAA